MEGKVKEKEKEKGRGNNSGFKKKNSEFRMNYEIEIEIEDTARLIAALYLTSLRLLITTSRNPPRAENEVKDESGVE